MPALPASLPLFWLAFIPARPRVVAKAARWQLKGCMPYHYASGQYASKVPEPAARCVMCLIPETHAVPQRQQEAAVLATKPM